MLLSPGCNCCSCTADASHVCICACRTPYPKTASIGDDLGTHTLSYTLGTPVAWVGNFTMTGAPVYTGDPNNCSGPITRDITCTYRLEFNCTTLKWTLKLQFPTHLCRTPPGLTGPVEIRYGGGGFTDALTKEVSSTIDLDCSNTSMLTFTLPTTVIGDAGTTPLAVPGGGGTLTIAF